MAGRPAAARGGSGMTYGLIAFAIVSVAALGAFIWQLTGNKQLQAAADEADRKLEQYGNPPSYYVNEASARNASVFNVMQRDIEQLAVLTVGDQDAVRPAIEQRAKQVLDDVASATGAISAGDTLLTAVQKLDRENRRLQSSMNQLRTEKEQLEQDYLRTTEDLKRVSDEFATAMAGQQEERARLQEEKQEQLSEKDAQLASFQEQITGLNEELGTLRQDRRRTEQDTEILVERLRNQIEDLQDKIRVLRPGGFDARDILTKADGRVLRAIPGSDVVYINLGEDARMKPGMRFEVFSPGAQPRPDFRGKASIEISAVMETTSEARVTRTTTGRPIVQDDVIVNIAYEQSREPRFVVRGDFDLDYDGQVDYDGVERVVALIRAWGGQVVDTLDESTDFLVVGLGPRRIDFSGDRPVSELVAALADDRAGERDEWVATIERAESLNIPVLPQSQFLFLTGYSGKGPVLTR